MRLLLALLTLPLLAAPAHAAITLPALGTPLALASLPGDVELADLDRDGDLDLVVASTAGSVQAFLNDGAGVFAASAQGPIALGSDVTDLLVRDVTGDGAADLVAAVRGVQRVELHPGDGTGRFGAASGTWSYAGEDPEGLAIGDVTCDGRADVIAALHDFHTIVIPGTATGLGAAIPSDVGVLDAPPDLVVVPDLTGDGAPDVALPNESGASLPGAVLTSDPGCSGGLTAAASIPRRSLQQRSVAAADWDGDGDVDLAIGDDLDTVVLLRRGTSGLEVEAQTTPAIGSDPRLAAGDLDGDGRSDLLSSAFADLGASPGGAWPFAAPTAFALPSPSGRDLAVGDVDGDGRPDVVVAVQPAMGNGLVSVRRNTTAWPAPAVTTGPSADATGTTATVTGTIDPRRLRVQWWFDHGPTAPYGSSTPERTIAAGGGATAVTEPLGALTPGTTVHYRLVTRGPDGVVTAGADAVLATPAPPPPPPPPVVSLTAKASVTAVAWRESRLRNGTLRVAGTLVNAPDGAFTIALRPAGTRGKPVLTGGGTTVRGAYDRRLRLPTTLPPGRYDVTVTAAGVSAGAQVRVQAPPEGVAASATISHLRRGPGTTILSGRRTRLWATFRLAALPRQGRLTVTWLLAGKVVGQPLGKPKASVVEATISAAAGLPIGRYEAVLKAGKVVVARATLRLR